MTTAPDRPFLDTIAHATSTPEEPQPWADLGLKPDEYQRIRDILGRRPTAAELEADTPWVARAVEVLSRVLPIEGDPRRSWVSVWPHALPVFDPALREAVTRVEQAIAPRSIHLAGSAFHGSGIDAAVRSAEAATARAAGVPSHASRS